VTGFRSAPGAMAFFGSGVQPRAPADVERIRGSTDFPRATPPGRVGADSLKLLRRDGGFLLDVGPPRSRGVEDTTGSPLLVFRRREHPLQRKATVIPPRAAGGIDRRTRPTGYHCWGARWPGLVALPRTPWMGPDRSGRPPPDPSVVSVRDRRAGRARTDHTTAVVQDRWFVLGPSVCGTNVGAHLLRSSSGP